jgi:hypothetical protein
MGTTSNPLINFDPFVVPRSPTSLRSRGSNKPSEILTWSAWSNVNAIVNYEVALKRSHNNLKVCAIVGSVCRN